MAIVQNVKQKNDYLWPNHEFLSIIVIKVLQLIPVCFDKTDLYLTSFLNSVSEDDTQTQWMNGHANGHATKNFDPYGIWNLLQNIVCWNLSDM